ncbi:variant leucine-rich repeat-containing protein [Nocardioides bruguierae]|uniref:variant leucine-rich repeat-containing protein n=1 Tax=Nocardioides bruguierae TaxID=2945102 RepID=UPI002020D276|nr:hypothetical protein [Nocardioides bruguierae]MCL8026027.1 hypothetical protein [Nocardioides bruguierae]
MPSINARARVAADWSTSPDTLSELASDSSSKVREAVAKNPSTYVEVLEVLVRDEKWAVRFAVAENPGPHALAPALGASDADVRGGAAQREDLDAMGARRVLSDPVHTVRERLAEVTRDEDAVAALARDPHPAVRSTIVLNPTISDADAEMLASDLIAQVRATAAGSRRLRPETLSRLAEDRSSVVRWSVLVNNPERLDLARKIAEDSDEMNASQAKEQIAHPRDFTDFLGEIDVIN